MNEIWVRVWFPIDLSYCNLFQGKISGFCLWKRRHFIPCAMLILVSHWSTARNIDAYHSFDVISMRYKEKETSLMTSQWRPSNTVVLQWFRPVQLDSWDFKTVETFHNITNIVWTWDTFVTPCLLPRIKEFIHTKHGNTTLGLRPCMVLWCYMWIYFRICVTKQGVTDNRCNTSLVDTWVRHRQRGHSLFKILYNIRTLVAYTLIKTYICWSNRIKCRSLH